MRTIFIFRPISHKKKCFLQAIACVMMLLFLCGCGTKQEPETPKLVIGYDNYRPYSYCDENGEPAGISMEIAVEACRRMGYEPVFKVIEWQNKDWYLQNKTVDCIWGCFAMNGAEENYSWVGPYMNGRQVVAVLQDSDIYKLSDLKGKRIAVKAGTPPEAIFLDRTNPNTPKVDTVCCLTDIDEVATALRFQYVDACAGYHATLNYLFDRADMQYRILDEDLLISKLGVAFYKGTNQNVRENLSYVLRQMQADGTINQILEAYGLDAEKALGGISVE